MLPSTGYFKGINCPFYDSGLCERPYCHFRHVKKDSLASTTNEAIESGTILQKLVTAAVQKVLQQTEASSSSTVAPQLVAAEDTSDVCKVNNPQTKATYNPTPIAELNKIVNAETENNDDTAEQRKRHIPVPYTPRKPASLPIKRPVETNGSSKPFIYVPPPAKYTPGCPETVHLDPYTPKGSTESNEKYMPGTETELQKYTPKDTQLPSKHNYIPSDRNISKKKILEYKPTKVGNKNEMPTVTYQPTPKSLVPCFSSDEDEPESKKARLSNDLNGLDDLGPEFDILDQILDEEKAQKYSYKDNEEFSKIASASVDSSKKHSDDKKVKESSRRHSDDSSKRHKSSTNKHDDKKSHDNKKSHDKIKSVKKEKLSSHSRNEEKPKESTKKSEEEKSKESTKKNEEEKSKGSTKKGEDEKSKEATKKGEEEKSREFTKRGHKSSSRDKSKEERKNKSPEKKKHSSSKGSEKKSKHSENHSSKSSERHSKHSSSSSSKHDKKRKDRKSDHNKNITKEYEDKKKLSVKESFNNDMSDNDSNFFADDSESCQKDDELIDLSESDEETIALECKRIFEEYVPTEKTTLNVEETKSNNQLLENINDNEYVPIKKRISRTTDKNIKILQKAPLKPDYKVSAAQTMANRLTKIKEFHSAKKISETTSNNNIVVKAEVSKNSLNVSNTTNSKIRIAHVPYASTLINAKRTITPQTRLKNEEPSTSSTTIQTVKKGTQRIAHMPNEKFIDRPGVLEPLASKIPANIRSTYLNMMIDECLKIYLSATDAYARAQHEELATSKKCSTVQIYKNSAVLTVSRLRKELQECNGIKKSGSECSALQKMTPTLSGNIGSVGSWSIESKNRRTVDNSQQFTGAKFYNNIKKWILTEEQLQENGFPRPHMSGEKGRAIIYGQNKKQIPPKGFLRTCCRCKKEYTVDKKGFPVIKEECIYHPNNKYRVRGEVKYQCCSQDSSSDGCCIAPCHVYEYVDFENLRGYIRTMPPETNVEDYGVYSLDCEMCYTTQGLDLTRVTVINSACKVVYETLIRPLHPIIDYNTRYSGITEEHMANVKTTLLEVQATLLSMFNSKTILIGHSLESDFKALKLIHDTVVDTSVLFPHKMGPPYKRALRNLSSEYLKKIIQNSVDGHDSAEDAMVCMELIIYKLKEDLKTR